MTTLTRIARSTAGTLSHTFLLDEFPADATGTVTYAVVDAAGNSITSGNATHAGTGTGTYQFVLPAQSSLNALTVSWSGTVAGSATTQQTYAEVVGGFLFSLAQARASDEVLSDNGEYTTQELIAGRLEVEAECEHICDRAFVPRYDRVVLDGTGRGEILLAHSMPDRSVAEVRTIRSVRMADSPDGTFTAFSVGQLADLDAAADGRLVRTGGDIFTAGRGNVIVEFEYGWNAPPPDLYRQALVRLRTVLNIPKSGVPDRASSFTMTDGGTFRLDMPGAFKTGIPGVDAAYGRYSRRTTGSGASARQVPASRTLTYNPQAASMFHGRRR